MYVHTKAYMGILTVALFITAKLGNNLSFNRLMDKQTVVHTILRRNSMFQKDKTEKVQFPDDPRATTLAGTFMQTTINFQFVSATVYVAACYSQLNLILSLRQSQSFLNSVFQQRELYMQSWWYWQQHQHRLLDANSQVLLQPR